MNVDQIIRHLSQFDGKTEVMILDGFNGGGNKRDINLRPSDLLTITKEDSERSGDCEGRVGEQVVVLGYGCY
jgi:hypothetical protein